MNGEPTTYNGTSQRVCDNFFPPSSWYWKVKKGESYKLLLKLCKQKSKATNEKYMPEMSYILGMVKVEETSLLKFYVNSRIIIVGNIGGRGLREGAAHLHFLP